MTVLALTGAASASTPPPAPLQWGPSQLIDRGAPFADPAALNSVACPTATTCLGVGTGGTVISTTGGVDTVTNGAGGGPDFNGISCPSASLCVAADRQVQQLLTSTDPTALHPSFTADPIKLAGPFDLFEGVSCASTTLCVATDSTGTVYVSNDPAGGASTWKAQTLAIGQGSVSGVSCAPGSTICVGGYYSVTQHSYGLATSTDPAAGASSWRLDSSPTRVTVLTCQSSSLCLAQIGADLDSTTDPAAGLGAWTGSPLPSSLATGIPGIAGIACADTAHCVAALNNGTIASTTTPTGGWASWSISGRLGAGNFQLDPQDAIACPAGGTCLVANAGDLLTVTVGPPASATSATNLGGFTGIGGLACPATGLCVGSDATGAFVHTTAPQGPAAGWTRTRVPARRRLLRGVDCPTTSLCVAVGTDTIETTTRPTGSAAWAQTTLGYRYGVANNEDTNYFPDAFGSVACPSDRLCVIGPRTGSGLVVSTRPTGGAGSWHLETMPGGMPGGNALGSVTAKGPQDYGAVACPSTGLCIAENAFGQVVHSTHPGAREAHWAVTRVQADPGDVADADAAACPSTGLCLVAGSYGSIFWTRNPTGPAKAWHRVSLGGTGIVAIACQSTQRCLVADATDQVYATSDPTGPASAWHATTLRFRVGSTVSRSVTALACTPTGPCLAATGSGELAVTTG